MFYVALAAVAFGFGAFAASDMSHDVTEAVGIVSAVLGVIIAIAYASIDGF